ncbi:homing endonuclease associated repeat-containing protein [Haloprofundus sp. MHR1]|uniref:homing endonuclease associated repeat-containing protein n=1 Tax=Haloprofundus sp. MHR1 TaxID=2572921 RepID=UPI0010BE9617|nr:helix-hairpin-helix domain-containing protein [Haloprofundus sp. MHR1]QCJ45655.1 hypothetical protein FCF25_00305 [Haloprofundus sp. MHR1]
MNKYIQDANQSLESVSKAHEDPNEVYRSVLNAHSSLCTALNSLSSSAPSNDGTSRRRIDSLKKDIEGLEQYAELIAADERVLVELTEQSSDSTDPLSESDIVQIRDFLDDIRDLPAVGQTKGLREESFDQFSHHLRTLLRKYEDHEPSQDELLSHVEQLANQLNRIPSHEDMRLEGRYNLNTYYDHFGSWSGVVKATDIGHYEAFLDDLRSVSEKLGRRPTSAEYGVHGEYTLSRLERAFGTWTRALEASRVDSATNEDLCNAIEKLAEERGRVPTARQMDQHGLYNSQLYADRFGNWLAAIEETSLDYRSDVIGDLEAVAKSLGRPPTTTEMDKHGTYSSGDVYNHFGSWEEAKEAIEVPEPQEKGSTERRDEILTSLEKLADTVGRVPNGSHMEEHGEYEQHEVTNEFGSWYEAIVATDLNPESDLIKDVREVAKKVGTPPTLGQQSTYGRYTPQDVYRYCDSWPELKTAAGVSAQSEVDALLQAGDTESPEEPSSHSVSPSELAERYEEFWQLSRAVHGLVEHVDPENTDSLMCQWRDLLSQFLSSGLEGWEEGYGPQQSDRSEVSMKEYRATYGDGDSVTEFQVIETAVVDPVIGNLLESLDKVDAGRSLRVPVIPDTAEPLAVFVETEHELTRAKKALAKFPERPSVDGWEWVDEGDVTPRDGDSQDTSNSSGDRSTQAVSELCAVGGIEEGEAESLIAAGFESVADLKHATLDELVRVDGISEGLAFRMKADVGGV